MYVLKSACSSFTIISATDKMSCTLKRLHSLLTGPIKNLQEVEEKKNKKLKLDKLTQPCKLNKVVIICTKCSPGVTVNFLSKIYTNEI